MIKYKYVLKPMIHLNIETHLQMRQHEKTDSLPSQALSRVVEQCTCAQTEGCDALADACSVLSAQNTSCLLTTGSIAAAGGEQVLDASRQKH